MTENEWLASRDPHTMLAYLRSSGKFKSRKLRLLGIAYCRWACLHYLCPSPAGAEAAEAIADREETSDSMFQGWVAAGSVVKEATGESERVAACALLRDLFRNPFRVAPAITPSLLTPKVAGLAQQIYEGRAFERMPELAAALEEVGCDDQEILSHSRIPGGHVKGCWLIDLILGKE